MVVPGNELAILLFPVSILRIEQLAKASVCPQLIEANKSLKHEMQLMTVSVHCYVSLQPCCWFLWLWGDSPLS